MIGIESIIGIGRSRGFEPEEYFEAARGSAAISKLEQTKPKTCDEIVTYFEGFARGMLEARALMAAEDKKKR